MGSEMCIRDRCTPKGRMVANFGMALHDGAAWISLPEDRIDPLQEALAKFLPFFGCQLDVTEWQGLGDRQPIDAPIQMDIGGLYEGWAPEDQTGDAGWAALRIEQALGWVDQHSHEAFTPQQLHLQTLNGISFTKGCYTGQEVIARTEHLGAVKKYLIPVSVCRCSCWGVKASWLCWSTHPNACSIRSAAQPASPV